LPADAFSFFLAFFFFLKWGIERVLKKKNVRRQAASQIIFTWLPGPLFLANPLPGD
jgi:hypothetical protein